MISRRSLLALPLLLPRVARAGTRPVLWIGDDGPRRATIITPTAVDLIPINNANTTFHLRVLYKRRRDDHWLNMQLGATRLRSSSMGHDDAASDGTFELDRVTAERAAAAFAIPLRERTKLDGGLRWTWTLPPTATTHVADPLPAKLRVGNAGTSPVGFAVGGRQRGARDNRFVFTIARNGTPVAIKDAPDFGGVMGYQALAPGQAFDLSADLRSWFAFDAPGHYAIGATYEGELQKAGSTRSTAAELADLWDIALTGQGAILIR